MPGLAGRVGWIAYFLVVGLFSGKTKLTRLKNNPEGEAKNPKNQNLLSQIKKTFHI
jgi:hypothetical protein